MAAKAVLFRVKAGPQFCTAVFPALPAALSAEYNGHLSASGAVAQLARAPALQAGCQGFESLQLHHFFLNILNKHFAGDRESYWRPQRRKLIAVTG